MTVAEEIIASFSQKSTYTTYTLPGRLTKMRCACGGQLREVRHVPFLESQPPWHRKRRIRKKWRKRWEVEQRARARIHLMIAMMRPPAFLCEQCGKTSGFYSTVGRKATITSEGGLRDFELIPKRPGEHDWWLDVFQELYWGVDGG